MDADPVNYHRYWTLQRRRRRDAEPYRQYRVSAGLPVDAAVSLSRAWHGDDRRHPLIGVSGYRLVDGARSSSVSVVR